MIMGLILLALSLGLTIGRSACRFFDRLGLNFFWSIFFQVALIVCVILPHLLVERQSVTKFCAIVLMALLTIVYAVYAKKVQRDLKCFLPTVVSAVLLIAVWRLSVGIDEFYRAALLAFTCFAGVAPFSKRHAEALISVLASQLIALAFIPMLWYAQIDFSAASVIFMSATIDSLFLVMPFMNAVKRRYSS